ncbi:MAG: tetratricopeptide repeat protein, partial [Kangiellaceae bacterium]|nr:tetratricopeptide repeat protein [Kangiellaceae bacterium]
DILNNIGSVYWHLEEFHTAFEYHMQALKIRKTLAGPPEKMAYSLNNIGLAYVELGEFTEALPYLEEALSLYKSVDNRRGEAAALTNIAGGYGNEKNYARAIEYYKRSKPVYRSIDNAWGIANADRNIGSMYIETGQFKLAGEKLSAALKLALEIDAKKIVYQAYKELSRLRALEKKYLDALNYYKKYTDAKSHLINRDKSRLIARLNARYEVNQKDTRIQLLLKEKEISGLIKLFLIICILLALLTLLLVYSRYRTKKKSSRIIESNEARYRALYDQAGDAIFLMDRETFLDCNIKALEMFKVTREWIIGKTIADISPKKQPDEKISLDFGKKYLEKAYANQPQSFFWKHIRSDYSLIDTMVSLTAITIEGKQYVQAIVHDITHRQQLEAERIRNEKLEAIRQLS